jgi:hypothetical protein
MSESTPTLERRLEQALRERAESMPVSVETRPLPVSAQPKRSRRPVVWAVAAAAVVLAVATVVIAQPFASDSKPATPTITTVPEPPSTTTPLPSPPTDAGAEVPLTTADTEDTQFVIRMQQRQNPTATPIAVVSPGLAPIVVTGPCLMIAVAPTNGTGYQGSCTSKPATTFVGSVDTGANLTPTSKVYGAWVDVPEGTAYVTYAYGTERWWQRPLDGITYLATDASPKYGGEPLVARARDASGGLLGEVRYSPIQVGPDSWNWF